MVKIGQTDVLVCLLIRKFLGVVCDFHSPAKIAPVEVFRPPRSESNRIFPQKRLWYRHKGLQVFIQGLTVRIKSSLAVTDIGVSIHSFVNCRSLSDWELHKCNILTSNSAYVGLLHRHITLEKVK